MEFVDSLDAAIQLPQLLERVGRGEELTITKHGKPIARLLPPVKTEPAPDYRAAVEALKAFRKGRSLGTQTIREMIEEGRKL